MSFTVILHLTEAWTYLAMTNPTCKGQTLLNFSGEKSSGTRPWTLASLFLLGIDDFTIVHLEHKNNRLMSYQATR